jgi:hypothetical protein
MLEPYDGKLSRTVLRGAEPERAPAYPVEFRDGGNDGNIVVDTLSVFLMANGADLIF